jgi:hypothetical protein
VIIHSGDGKCTFPCNTAFLSCYLRSVSVGGLRLSLTTAKPEISRFLVEESYKKIELRVERQLGHY